VKKLSLPLIGFIQAIGLTIYCSLVALIFWRGNEWFGKMNNLLGPTLVLSLLVVSTLICALIALGYPVWIFWEKKDTKKALRLVAYTAGWLALFVILVMLGLLIF